MWFAMDALTNVTKLKAQNDMNVSLFWLLVPSRFYWDKIKDSEM